MTLLTTDPAILVLEDGTRHVGRAYGARGTTLGEVVFATGMTGYQETLTDPSYAGQIVLQTAPHIGNTGMNAEDPESRRIWVSGYIVRDPSRVVSNWRADESLDDALVERRRDRHQRHRHARGHPPHPLGRKHARRDLLRGCRRAGRRRSSWRSCRRRRRCRGRTCPPPSRSRAPK